MMQLVIDLVRHTEPGMDKDAIANMVNIAAQEESPDYNENGLKADGLPLDVLENLAMKGDRKYIRDADNEMKHRVADLAEADGG